MMGLSPLVRWLWALSILAQLLVCALLFVRGHFRKLPGFTAYVAVNICQAGFLAFLYPALGFESSAASVIAWISQAVAVVVKALAVAEVCRQLLRAYRGVWELSWRLLVVASAGILFYAAAEASNHRDAAALAILAADRGLELAIAVTLVGLLLLIRYYSVPVHPAFRALATGFCLYSCLVVINNSIHDKWVADYIATWNVARLIAYILVLSIWGIALWKPLPSCPPEPPLLPPSVYKELSPKIHARLHSLNDKLSCLLKLQRNSDQ